MPSTKNWWRHNSMWTGYMSRRRIYVLPHRSEMRWTLLLDSRIGSTKVNVTFEKIKYNKRQSQMKDKNLNLNSDFFNCVTWWAVKFWFFQSKSFWKCWELWNKHPYSSKSKKFQIELLFHRCSKWIINI